VPLWFGIKPTESNAERIAELGVGWVPIGTRVEFVSNGTQRIRQAFEKAGRDPASLRVRGQLQIASDRQGRPDFERSLETLSETVDAGATDIAVVPGTYIHSRDELGPFFERFAAAVGKIS